MKKLLIICLCLALAACEKDFDELSDTSQRHIAFEFSTDALFTEVLKYENGTFYLDDVSELPSGRAVRISAYCYNELDSLIFRQTQIASMGEYRKIKIRHLDGNFTYRFVFIADVVTYNSSADFYEVWVQMKTQSFSDFYFYSDFRSDDCVDNIMGEASYMLQPANQDFNVEFRPLTYNGYYVLGDLASISVLEGNVFSSVSMCLDGLKSVSSASPLGYLFEYENPKEKTIVKPVTLNFADMESKVKIKTTVFNKVDSIEVKIVNEQLRPFVATFDCDDLEMTECKYY